MSVAGKTERRTPLTIGWEAAKANAIPALILQALHARAACRLLFQSVVCARAGIVRGIATAVWAHCLLCSQEFAGGIVPEIFLILFFQHGKFLRRENLRNLAFTIPTWAVDGILVDWMYRLNAIWFGSVVTVPVVIAKICVDQFGYNPFFAAPTAKCSFTNGKTKDFPGRRCDAR